ncbi:hypothetical protein HZU38_09265 [Mycolicibacterium vanbaalenii]|nr:hypothetical protein HZU38_09265 [Mycolicibacterium vanbaalenii]
MLAKIPTGMEAEVRDGYWAIFDTTDLTADPGPRLVEIIDKRIEAFAANWDLHPAAMRILLTEKAGLTAYLRFPVEHHGRVRPSNFLERSFGETTWSDGFRCTIPATLLPDWGRTDDVRHVGSSGGLSVVIGSSERRTPATASSSVKPAWPPPRGRADASDTYGESG